MSQPLRWIVSLFRGEPRRGSKEIPPENEQQTKSMKSKVKLVRGLDYSNQPETLSIENKMDYRLTEQLLWVCKFSKSGCEYIANRLDDWSSHVKCCYYRDVRCLFRICTGTDHKSSYAELFRHLIDCHEIRGSIYVPVNVSYCLSEFNASGTFKWKPYFVQAHGCVFFIMLEYICPSFFGWALVQSPKKDLIGGAKFTAVLHLANPETGLSTTWRVPVSSIRTPVSVIKKECLYFSVPGALMNTFVQGGLISIFVNIEKPVACQSGQLSSNTYMTDIGKIIYPQE